MNLFSHRSMPGTFTQSGELDDDVFFFFFYSLWGCCDLKLFVVILSVCILFSLRLSILFLFFSFEEF